MYIGSLIFINIRLKLDRIALDLDDVHGRGVGHEDDHAVVFVLQRDHTRQPRGGNRLVLPGVLQTCSVHASDVFVFKTRY